MYLYDDTIFERRTKELLTEKVNNEVNIKVIQTKSEYR